MLRQVVCCVQRAIILQTNCKPTATMLLQPIVFQKENYLGYRRTGSAAVDTEVTSNNDDFSEVDSEYIVPYNKNHEVGTTSSVLVEALRTRFRLKSVDVNRIMSDDIVNRAYRERYLLRTLDVLCEAGVTKKSFVEYPWLITLDKFRLEKKLSLIRSLKIRDINEWVPFLRLSLNRLQKLCNGLRAEANNVPFGNRVYYISNKLKLEPSVVTKYLPKRLFILEMPFELMESNLNNMLEYNVSPINMLKDLWAFRYTPKSVQKRLERVKSAKKEKIMPWMVRCPETVLERTLKLTQDELTVLGNKSTVAEYIGERLKFSENEAKGIMAKHPQVNTVRVTKIKEVLDYLLDDAGFTRYEIAQVPRILCHSLETTKQRVEELKSMGCRPTTLIILCRSKREYEKFVSAWLENQQKRKSQNPNKEDSTGASV